MNEGKKTLIKRWVEWNEPYDKPNRFWPFLTIFVLFAFFLYTLNHYYWLFYFSLITVIAGISGWSLRNYYRIKKKQ